mmetsp:Transcript_11605/g.19448  ORF Transcript_11605/g.19448 Transcript_11605/m.19448 type:complete len:168 (+) Transcript_11605:78-581(+)
MYRICVLFVILSLAHSFMQFSGKQNINVKSTKRYQVPFAQQMAALSSAKDIILSDSGAGLSKTELNEYILKVDYVDSMNLNIGGPTELAAVLIDTFVSATHAVFFVLFYILVGEVESHRRSGTVPSFEWCVGSCVVWCLFSWYGRHSGNKRYSRSIIACGGFDDNNL